MNLVVRLFAIWSICLTLAWAQEDYDFSLEGNYPINSQSFRPITVTYTIQWNEKGNRINGIYTDNYFGTSLPVTGTTTTFGRSLDVTLTEPVQGVETLNFLTSQVGLHNGDVTLVLTTRNSANIPLGQQNIEAVMGSRVMNPVTANDSSCIVGFGVLSGFCGQYAGTISEVYDPNNYCNLLEPGVTKLELGEDQSLRLYFQTSGNNLRGRPSHEIGKLPLTPMDENVDITGRICSVLPGVNFLGPEACKILNLTGAFQELGGSHNFTGTYTIRDEMTDYQCRYSLSLYRDVEY